MWHRKSLRRIFALASTVCAFGWAPPSAQAIQAIECYDCAISFASAGTITVDLLGNGGLFDHVLAVTSGASAPSPIFALVSTQAPYDAGATVAGSLTPDASSKSFAYSGGNLALTFTLYGYDPSQSNVPLATVVSTGLSTGTGIVYDYGTSLSFAEGLGTNSVTVHMTDLFAGTVRDDFKNLEFQVTLAPVPEPHEWAMMLAGLGAVGVVARRRRHHEAT